MDIALALQRLLVRVHRVGNIDRDHQFDVDRNGARALVGKRAAVGAAEAASAKRRGRQHAGDGAMKTASPHNQNAGTRARAKKRPLRISLSSVSVATISMPKPPRPT